MTRDKAPTKAPVVPTVEGEIVDPREEVGKLKRKVDKVIEQLDNADRRYHRRRKRRRGRQ